MFVLEKSEIKQIQEIYSNILVNSFKNKSLRSIIYQRKESDNLIENWFDLSKHEKIEYFLDE